MIITQCHCIHAIAQPANAMIYMFVLGTDCLLTILPLLVMTIYNFQATMSTFNIYYYVFIIQSTYRICFMRIPVSNLWIQCFWETVEVEHTSTKIYIIVFWQRFRSSRIAFAVVQIRCNVLGFPLFNQDYLYQDLYFPNQKCRKDHARTFDCRLRILVSIFA